MMVNCMVSCVYQIITYDLNNILSVMIACTATFVAIIGGLIANKAITDRAEKESIERQLSQIKLEIEIADKKVDSLDEWLNVRNAKDFIRDHLDELLAEENLGDFYEDADNEDITQEELLPYWNKALEAVKKFKANAYEERNKDNVPKSIIDELDSFQYDICSSYPESIGQGNKVLFETVSLSNGSIRAIVERYNEKVKELEEELAIKEQLIVKESMLKDIKQDVIASKPVKNGIRIFVLVSLFCIVMPLIFMLFNPTTNCVWYAIEIVLSFVSFIIGILVMIIYICSLFPKKNDDVIDKDE